MASIKRIGKDKFGVPIWKAMYRRSRGGKQVMRHFHMATKADVERAILLDSQRSDIGLKWSEGVNIYLEAKRGENRSAVAMGHVERAASVFIELMGDLAIEATTPEYMKEFMQAVVTRPVKNKYTGKTMRQSGPKVANHHRKELFTVARYLLRHTGKITTIPFQHVPSLPVKTVRRSPVPADKVNDYLNALPPPVRRPVMTLFYYGLRSSAVCNLTMGSIDGAYLIAMDKWNVVRRIPIDDMLAGIIEDAKAYRATLPDPPDNLFVSPTGKAFERTSLLRAAQKAWVDAGLEKKKIHELRHTLGTLAGKSFTAGMVQAAMGHRSRKSAEVYFHPTEEMAAEVRQKIITDLSQEQGKSSKSGDPEGKIVYTQNGRYECPCCHANLLIEKE